MTVIDMDTLTKLKYIIVFIIGIAVGLLIAYALLIVGIDAIGSSFQIQSVNVTVAINETAIIEAQKAMRGI